LATATKSTQTAMTTFIILKQKVTTKITNYLIWRRVQSSVSCACMRDKWTERRRRCL
jgi:hypothetical protein